MHSDSERRMRGARYVACMGENTAVTKLMAGIFFWLGTGSSLLMWRVLVQLCAGDYAGYLSVGKNGLLQVYQEHQMYRQ
jgi:hypothetical protein